MPRLNVARNQRMPERIDNLPVHRRVAVQRDSQDVGCRGHCLMYKYNIHLTGERVNGFVFTISLPR